MPKVRHDHDSNGYYAALDCYSYGTAHVLLCQLQSKPNLHATSRIGDTWTHFLVSGPCLAWEKLESPTRKAFRVIGLLSGIRPGELSRNARDVGARTMFRRPPR
jgi:hypothetical protein